AADRGGDRSRQAAAPGHAAQDAHGPGAAPSRKQMTSFSAALHKQGLLVRHGRPADEAQQGDAFAKTRPALTPRFRLGALAHPVGRHSSQWLPRDGAVVCTFLDRAVLIGHAYAQYAANARAPSPLRIPPAPTELPSVPSSRA